MLRGYKAPKSIWLSPCDPWVPSWQCLLPRDPWHPSWQWLLPCDPWEPSWLGSYHETHDTIPDNGSCHEPHDTPPGLALTMKPMSPFLTWLLGRSKGSGCGVGSKSCMHKIGHPRCGPCTSAPLGVLCIWPLHIGRVGYTTLEPLKHQPCTTLASALHHSSISLAPLWHEPCTALASALHPFGIGLAPLWHQPCTALASPWHHLGVTLTSARSGWTCYPSTALASA